MRFLPATHITVLIALHGSVGWTPWPVYGAYPRECRVIIPCQVFYCPKQATVSLCNLHGSGPSHAFDAGTFTDLTAGRKLAGRPIG